FSPVKVQLTGENAAINSNDHFWFSLGGFNSPIPPTQTTGGLNTREAWLAVDRENNGFYRGQVLDGNDIFGDHMGKYKSGYEDLADVFKANLKTDAQGKRYIPLKPMSFWQRLWIWFTRLFWFNKEWNPSCDLKLLTRNHKVLNASDFFSKIYVD